MNTKKDIQDYLNDSLPSKIIESDVPDATKTNPCILGIDEAGRGPVLGPMLYAAAYYPQKSQDVLAKLKFADSKALTESTRDKLFESIIAREGGNKDLGFVTKVLSPNFISNCMLRRQKYNLNALSHDTAIELIKLVQSQGVRVAHAFVDTVGPADKYKDKLQRFFPNITFTVSEKADSKYPIVSAASVCAKVMRDRIVLNWKYLESQKLFLEQYELGSGYPSDPTTKLFIEKSVDPVFGYPTLTRFSWSTITKALEKHGCKCDWNEPDDDVQDVKELNKQQKYFKGFVTKGNKAKQQDLSKLPGIPMARKVSNTKAVRTNADKLFDDLSISRQIKSTF